MKVLLTRMFEDFLKIGGLVVFLSATSAILMFHVWNQYRIVQAGYQIAEVTNEHRRLMEEHRKLSIEAAVVGRTERLTSVARERYGLVPVQPGQVRMIALDVAGTDDTKTGIHAALAR